MLRGTPTAIPPAPAANTSAGLTPQMALVNADRTPTVFFFRWLLNSRAAAQTGQTPWLSDIDAAGFSLNNLGGIELDAGAITFPDGTIQTTAAVAGGVTGVTASAPLASSGGATPNITITSPLPVANGGSGSATPSLIAGANVTITGAWPNQTISAAAGTSAVSSVFGRAGAVVAVSGDYTVAQVTGAVATSRQIIAGAGLTGGGDLSADRTLTVNTAAIAGAIQTPWLQNINAAGFQLQNAGKIGIGGTPAFPLDIHVASGNHIRVANPAAGSPQVLISGGSAGVAPVLQFTVDDTPTKAVSVGSGLLGAAITNDLVFGTYTSPTWTERMRLTNSGAVGIGTSAPQAGQALDVNGLIRFGPAAAASAAYITSYNDVANLAQFGICGSAHPSYPNAGYISATSGKLVILANNSLAISVTTTGVGIGMTPSAGQSLDVNGLIRFGPAAAASAAYITGYNDVANLAQFGICGSAHPSYPNAGYISTTSGKFVFLAASGVGIGVNPAYTLDVAGTINGQGALRLPALPSASPGAGTKQLWYDPADGNRVKFAA